MSVKLLRPIPIYPSLPWNTVKSCQMSRMHSRILMDGVRDVEAILMDGVRDVEAILMGGVRDVEAIVSIQRIWKRLHERHGS